MKDNLKPGWLVRVAEQGVLIMTRRALVTVVTVLVAVAARCSAGSRLRAARG